MLLTPLPPRPRTGGKQKVAIVDSEGSDTKSYGRRRRQRRGRGPRKLTVLLEPGDPDKIPEDNNDFVFSGVGNTQMPNRTVNFPWGFSIPLTETGRADPKQPHFARVREEDMKSVLTQIGFSVGGKTKNQLINMCVVYALLIQDLSVPARNISSPPNTPQPALSEAVPRDQRSTSNHNSDLIQFDSPIRQDPTSQSAAAPALPETDGQHLGDQLPSSLPALTPDIPRNNGRDSDHKSPPSHTQLPLRQNHSEIIRLLNVHSEQISAMQADIASTLRHQQEIKEKLEEISDNMQHSTTTKQKTKPTESRTSSLVSRTGKLKVSLQDSSHQLIQHHFAALFGLPEGAQKLPSPPTASEKKRWLKQPPSAPPGNSEMECDREPDADSSGDGESNADSSGDSDADSSCGDRESDADFSGASDDIDSGSNADAIDSQSSDCGGPGLCWASQEQLKIICNTMKARNMKRFRMDFNLPLSGPENTFCLELARDTFVALLECGEYDGLQPHESKPEVIMQQMRNYVKDVFVRKFREQRKWPREKRSVRAQQQTRNSRRKNVCPYRRHIKSFWLQSALEIGGLKAFLPIICNCCSDNETDDEVPPQTSTSRRTQKLCKIIRLPWQSEEVSEAFTLLDDYRDRQEAGKPEARKGAKPRLRRRPPPLKDSDGRILKGPMDSGRKPVKGLPEEVYDKDCKSLLTKKRKEKKRKEKKRKEKKRKEKKICKPLTPSPPRPRTGGKQKVATVDSEGSDTKSYGRWRRQRRCRGPRKLTVLLEPGDPDNIPEDNNDFVFLGVGKTQMPNRTVNFPWGFSIPLTETGRADPKHPHFARVREEDMKSVLTQIGCSVGGKTKNQLIDMCVVYAPLIQDLSVPARNISSPPNTPQPALSEAVPRDQRSTSNHNSDLIQFDSPIRQDPTSQSAAAPALPETDGQHLGDQLPSSLPALTPDIPRNNGRDSDHKSPPSHTQLPLRQNHSEIIRLLNVHSEQISAMQADIASTLRHQQEIKEKLEEISDNMQHSTTTKQKTKPTESRTSSLVSRTGKLKVSLQDSSHQLIQHHFAALFGLPEGAQKLPSPPTASEKKRWLKQPPSAPPGNSEMECDREPDADSSGDGESNADSSGDSDADSSCGDRESDADFSGASDDIDSGSNADAIDSQSSDCGGPGLCWASQEQLKIICNTMKARNMKRFRMDFNLPLSGPENTFCLELARDTFVALLECGEYDGLQPHESKPEVIMQQMRNYVKDVFVRKFREQRKWPREKRSVRAQQQTRNSRRKNVCPYRRHIKSFWLQSALEIGGLKAFLPIICNCCSDNETDDEVPPQTSTSRRTQKLCKIIRLPWQSEEVSEAFTLLDDYRDRQEAGKPEARKGAKPRLRRRPPPLKDSDGRILKGPMDSGRKPVKGLPEEVYDKDW
ncbi:hypothetical protein VP01_1970g1 [Puccinia sorghi]|uniref:Uncharacterized protein n=1 Tax=Puccinia sorghi TaxID=27349 RepID=A0A0L6VBR8_9BASI|nr:hypothetical protein VP01_1970g1 [Puccinia sorghi]